MRPQTAPVRPLFGVFQSSKIELEFKFYADSASLGDLEHSGWIDSLATADAKPRELVTEYYDTPDQALRRAGYRLRLRIGGGDRSLIAKKRIWARDGLFRRLEWKLPVGENQGVHDIISANDDMARLGIDSRDLAPVFRTHISRVSRKLRFTSATGDVQIGILLAVDRGTVATPTLQAKISEAEFELLEGPEEQLTNFATEARKRFTLTPGDLSKADRGYGLLSGAAWEADSCGGGERTHCR